MVYLISFFFREDKKERNLFSRLSIDLQHVCSIYSLSLVRAHFICIRNYWSRSCLVLYRASSSKKRAKGGSSFSSLCLYARNVEILCRYIWMVGGRKACIKEAARRDLTRCNHRLVGGFADRRKESTYDYAKP